MSIYITLFYHFLGFEPKSKGLAKTHAIIRFLKNGGNYLKVTGEVIKQIVISEELEICLIKRSKDKEIYDLLLSSKEWNKGIPLADNLVKAALTFVKLVEKFSTKYQQLGLDKFKAEIDSVDKIKLTPEQESLFNEIISGGKSRIIN